MIDLLKKTRIVATLGPASNTLEKITGLLHSGVDVFRLNFSHGSHAEHARLLQLIKTAAAAAGRKPAVLADLQGPKIRTGHTEQNQTVTLEKGAWVRVTAEDVICTHEIISIDYPLLLRELARGDTILINDGAIKLEVNEIDKTATGMTCQVLNSGSYSSRKGVNFPHANLSIPALTAKDRADLAFILTQDFHFIALSFVRRPEDLIELNEIIRGAKKNPRVIAKIEKPEATKRIDEILEHCDGIMVARGDLGVEASLDQVPVIQKDLIRQANQQGKAVIVATQMLESMIANSSPTRAETTDVANAILDGTDAVMLSGETAAGQYPVEVVDVMTQIIRTTEASSYFSPDLRDLSLLPRQVSHAVCEAAAWASRDLGDIPILVFTATGATAWYLAKIRAQAPLFAFSPNADVVSQLALAWNTTAFTSAFEEDLVQLLSSAEKTLLEKSLVQAGDSIVAICGTVLVEGATNFLRIKQMGKV